MPCLHWPVVGTSVPSASRMARSKEAGGLVLPNADADIVIDVLQGVDVGHGEASAEIAGGGWIGDALGAQSVEIIDIIASQFDVLQTIAVAQGVEGEVEHMIGFGIRADES